MKMEEFSKPEKAIARFTGEADIIPNPGMGPERDGDAIPGDMSIGEMSQMFAVSLRTLRFYEDRGLLSPRRLGTARFYNDADRRRLRMILKGKQLGFTLAEISDMIGRTASAEADFEEKLRPEQIVGQIGHLERQRAEIDSALERLRDSYRRLEGAAALA